MTSHFSLILNPLTRSEMPTYRKLQPSYFCLLVEEKSCCLHPAFHVISSNNFSIFCLRHFENWDETNLKTIKEFHIWIEKYIITVTKAKYFFFHRYVLKIRQPVKYNVISSNSAAAPTIDFSVWVVLGSRAHIRTWLQLLHPPCLALSITLWLCQIPTVTSILHLPALRSLRRI